MKMKTIKYLFLFAMVIPLVSCEYFQSPDDTATVREGFITFPAVTLNGDRFITIPVGGSFDDPGVVATLGSKDVSGDVVVTGQIDPSTPGVYTLDYSVSVVNELDEVSAASQQRFVAVISESVSNVDLSGQWNGDGTAAVPSWNQAATVTRISGSWYSIDKALASGNNLSIFFAVVGGGAEGVSDKIVVPDQGSPFGNVNSTDPGASAELTDNGFQWQIFIGCCGVFGPIIYSR